MSTLHTHRPFPRAEEDAAELDAMLKAERRGATVSAIQPVTTADRSGNDLRPITFDTIIGQVKVKKLLARMIEAAQTRGRPLDHVLLVGPSGTGKTTIANIIAHEMDARCFQVEAPVGIETLAELRETMEDGDVLFIDEIHGQASQDRRGASASMSPETFYNVLEDRRLVYNNEVLDFPHITCVGATTDEGLLPAPFLNRFPIRPRLERYTEEECAAIAQLNAKALELYLGDEEANRIARASRGVPREINNLVKNCAMLTADVATAEVLDEVIHDLNGLTDDGLTYDMQNLLAFLVERCQRTRQSDGQITYQASIATLATAIGKSRDVKSLQLYVEPFLLERGFLQVSGGGRLLTDDGLTRAREVVAAR